MESSDFTCPFCNDPAQIYYGKLDWFSCLTCDKDFLWSGSSWQESIRSERAGFKRRVTKASDGFAQYMPGLDEEDDNDGTP